MSIPAQGKSGRGYGKPIQYSAGNKYSYKDRNSSGSATRRENIPPYRVENVPRVIDENICVEPPLWLDSYLQNFKKTLIKEITDDVIKAFDASYKNDTEKRRFKSSYFALKRRLATLEAQQNAEGSQQQGCEKQSTMSYENNDENKTGKKKTREKFYHSRNGWNGSHYKRSNEPMTSPSNNIYVDSTTASSSISICVNEHEKETDEELTYEHVEDKNAESVQPFKITTLQSAFITNTDNNMKDTMKMIIEVEQKDEESSFEEMSSPDSLKCASNEKYVSTKNNEPLKEDPKLLNDNTSEELSSATNHSTINDYEIEETLCKKVQNMLNNLTFENFDVLSEQVKDLKVDTPEKQQEVINLFIEWARDDTYSVVYAQMCKKIAVEHECVPEFREILITQCDAELIYHKETEKKKIQEFNNNEGKEKAQEITDEVDQENPNEFLGALLFMGELYNQELLPDTVIEKCFQYLLQNDTVIGLEYLCHVLQLVGKNLILQERSITPYMNHLVESLGSSEISASLTQLINSVVELMTNNGEPLVPDGSSETTDFEDATDD